jgi:hypothetical protein
MGVFDFLKGKQRTEADIPPPPPLEEEELPEFPEIPEEKDIKELLEKPEISIEKIERTAVREEKEELEEFEHPKYAKPIFVNVKNYRDVLDELGLIKNIINENTDVVSRVGEFKGDEDKEFEKWQKLVEDIQKKLIFVDKTLFG